MRKVLTFLKILISFFILFNCIKSCAKATTILEAFDMFVEGTTWNNAMYSGSATNNGTSMYSYANFRNLLSSKTDNAFCIISAGTDNLVSNNVACYYYAGQSFSNEYARLNGCSWFGQKNNYSFNNVYSYNGGNNSNYNTSYSGKFLYLFLENGQIVNTNIERAPTFEFIKTASVKVTFDNNTEVYAMQNSYNVLNWQLGYFDLEEEPFLLECKLMTEGEFNKNIYIQNGTMTSAQDIFYIVKVDNRYRVWVQSRGIYYNKLYTLVFNYYDRADNYYPYEYYFVFLPPNAVINNNTIVSTGSGDFTNQDVTNTIIDNIYNNNSGEKGIFQKVYDDLFTLGSGDVKSIISSLSNSSPFSSGELQLATIGLSQLLANQSDDFVISWESFTPHFSIHGEQINNVQMISGDHINFSKLVRESPELTEVMVWVHRLVGFSLLYLFAHNVFKTLMYALGVGTQIFDSTKDEQDTVKTTINIDKNGKKSMTTTEKYGNLTIRRNK